MFSHAGSAGGWIVLAGVLGDGTHGGPPGHASGCSSAGPLDHVMVVGIAGGLDPALPVGGLMVPRQVRLHPDGPLYHSHPLPLADRCRRYLMTTDGLFSDEAVWRPILESGFGAVDMEAAGVAEACEQAGVDWSVYRGISDRPDENIVDQAVFALSKPDGSADLAAVGRVPDRATHAGPKCWPTSTAAHGTGRPVAATAAFEDLRRR